MAARDGEALPLVDSLAWYRVLRGRLGEGRRALTAAPAGGGPDDVAGTVRVWHAGFSLLMGVAPGLAPPPATRPAGVEAGHDVRAPSGSSGSSARASAS